MPLNFCKSKVIKHCMGSFLIFVKIGFRVELNELSMRYSIITCFPNPFLFQEQVRMVSHMYSSLGSIKISSFLSIALPMSYFSSTPLTWITHPTKITYIPTDIRAHISFYLDQTEHVLSVHRSMKGSLPRTEQGSILSSQAAMITSHSPPDFSS